MQINIYVPDELGRRLKRSGLPLSRICQAALRSALEGEVPEEEVMDTVEGIAEALKDMGHRHDRELRRLATVITEQWTG